jgi:hypothetical protein
MAIAPHPIFKNLSPETVAVFFTEVPPAICETLAGIEGLGTLADHWARLTPYEQGRLNQVAVASRGADEGGWMHDEVRRF